VRKPLDSIPSSNGTEKILKEVAASVIILCATICSSNEQKWMELSFFNAEFENGFKIFPSPTRKSKINF
jgi:hypothetical protein